MLLDDLALQYDSAEITLVLADIDRKRCVLVYGVVELCPERQPRSPEVVTPGFAQYRKAIGDGITLYSKRLFVSPQRALKFFRNPEQEDSGLRNLPIELAGKHYVYPEGEEPLLLSPNAFEKSGLGAVLPRRATSLRVVSKFDTEGATLRLFSDTQQKAMVAVVHDILGIDLARFSEHVGALHICFSNPIVGRFEVRLSRDQRHLLLSVVERPGKSISGSMVELSNELPFGEGFSFLHQLDSRYNVIPLPADPSSLRLRLFDSSRRCIESHPAASFIRDFSIETFSISERQVDRTLADGSIETTVSETAHSLNARSEGGRPVESPIARLKAAGFRRELDDLRENKIFMFFAGTGSSRVEAVDALRDLLRQARKTVTVIDSYLTIDDVSMLVGMIHYTSCEVRFLAANAKLSKRNDQGITVESRMLAGLAEIHPQLSFPVKVKKLPGEGPHDRWLQVDGQIYALGSSINHFGERATMLFKLPRPEEIADQIEQWWADAKQLGASAPVRKRKCNPTLLGILAGFLVGLIFGRRKGGHQ